MDENTLRFDPPTPAVQSVSVDTSNQLVAPTAEELLSANPALGILQERTQNMSASPSGTSIEKGLTVSGNLQFSDSISNEPTEIEAPNTVQVKGYFIQYFDKTNFSNGTGTMDIYVGDEEFTYEQGIENQSSPASTFYNAGVDTQYEVGDLISFRNKYSFICGGQITAISGNKITLGQFTDFLLEQMPTTTTWLPDEGADQTELNFDAYSLWNMNRPTLGSVVLNNIAFAFGANLNSLGKASFAQGFDSKAYGAYSIATGRGTTAGSYAQFVCGRNNSPDYNQKLLFIVGGGWGPNLKNVCTVDYGGNLVLAAGSSPQPSETASITATNGHFSGSIDVESSVSVGSVELTEESLQETQDNISALQTSVTAITSKTQNQSATSGNTSFTGNLTVSGTISTGSMSDIAGKVSQNQSAISEIQSEIPGIQTDVSTLALSKLPYGTLHFNQGKLSVGNWTSVVIQLPFSLAIEYEVESWEGISYEYNNEFSFFNCTNADWNVSGYPIYGFRLTKNGESTLGFTLGGCGGEGMGASRGWTGSITLPTGRHTLALAVPAPDASGNNPASIPVYIDGENAGSLSASVGKHNESVSFQRPLVINERGVYAGGATFNEFEIALSRISVFNFDITAEDAPYTIADYAAGKLIPPALKPSQVSLALDNYTIARNSTTTLVKDASGNSCDATVTGSVAGDNDQSIKAFVDEIKTQINQANG